MRAGIRSLLILLAVVSGQSLSAAKEPHMVTRRWGTPPGAPAAKGVRSPLPVGYAPKLRAGASAPKIDGKLTDPCWAAAPAMALAKSLSGNARAAQPTEVKALRDADTLYFAFRCAEPAMDKLRATRRSHDGAIWSDDSMEMFLGSGATYYHFGVNALGSTYDGRVKDASWNSGVRAAAAKGPKEWTAELAIPLKGMVDAKALAAGKLPVRWVANFNRNRYVTGRLQESAWSPTLSGESHVPARFGKLMLSDPPAEKPQAVVEKESVTILPAAGGEAVVRFDLSALPKGAKIYRADLLVFRKQLVTGRDDEAMVDIEIHPLFSPFKAGAAPKVSGKPLGLRAPWLDRFDVTEPVRQWAGGKPNGGFFVKACPFLDAAATCLDVAYRGEGGDLPPQATGARAFHRAGQTFITWKEIEDPAGSDTIRWAQLRGILAGLDAKRRVRYCIYRSDKPIDSASLHQAELIAAVAPLSGWNVNGRNVDKPIDDMLGNQYALAHHQWNPFVGASVEGKYGVDCLMERLVIRDGEKPLPRGTGLYVHTANRKGKAYYAVVTSIDGVENTAEFSGKNSLASPVTEAQGAGEPVLQKVFPPKPYFNYREKRLHYVRWVSPPYCNLPSQYYNWSVGVPEGATMGGAAGSEKAAGKIPVELSLHRDGRSYYRTQYRVENDSVVLSPHDFPVKTWWYGYHESLGTLQSFRQGRIHNYTERRLLAFIDWLAGEMPIDRSRILVTGCRGGAAGSGALHLGIRHPKVFNLVLSGYGLANYAGEIEALAKVRRAGAMPAEMASVWGSVEWGLKTDTGKSVWDELNLTKTVAALPAKTDLPLVTLTGRGMSKPTRDFVVAMIESGQPIMCRFGVYGGGTLIPVSRTGTWSRMVRQDMRLDQSMPVFRGPGSSSLWAQPKEPSGNLVVSDGIRWWWGVINTDFRWKTDDLVDKRSRYEITLFWAGSRRVRKPYADVTLRRIQKFGIRPEWEYRYELRNPAGEVVKKGTVKSGKNGTFAFKGVVIPTEGVRLIITP